MKIKMYSGQFGIGLRAGRIILPLALVSFGTLLFLLIILLLFGASRLRDIGGALGGAIRDFRGAVSGADEEQDNGDEEGGKEA